MAGVVTIWGRRAAGAALGALLCAAAVEPVALAETPDTPGAPRDDGARAAQIYSVGVAAAREGRWPEAYAAYLEAWTLKQHFQIAANLAQAELKLGKHRDAAEHIAFFLREAEGVSERDRARARRMLDEAKAKIATLTLIVSRERATVLVDGAPAGTSPLGREVYVEPGQRTLEARLQGERPAKASVTLAPGASQAVELRFAERAAPAPAIQARTPPQRPPPAADRGAAGPSVALVAAGGAATGLALGTAVLLRVVADRSARSGSDAAVPGADSCYARGAESLGGARCREVHRRRLEAARLYDASAGVFAAAGVLGAATVGYALLGWLRADGRPPVTTAPVALAPGAGISLNTRW
ncbi:MULTISPECIES: hypothetical protein [Sorangium]|uniref:PEGA domain-containing protein n=1 Tax=Sorangium cellulosum TaxID=56 RepID=A0A4P2QWQ7_SORCE|nr:MULTISPECIES: hypothetical protein [Sorangium]AUX34668.1 uncharacterized protein SOCE836_068440 [Sorangium cellulosum]WCQ93980.1 hypothetical protein NQZ70_06737 [Sorangium sp. Soce836]